MTQAEEKFLIVRALHTQQKIGIDTYAFFLPGASVVEIADISRLARDESDSLKGFQRKEIRNHVSSITEYLKNGNVLFPNAIILAFGSEVEFKQSRGPSPQGMTETAISGTLYIPIREEGKRVAWIVDGQQRSLALSRSANTDLPVPVIAFVSSDLEVQREQFILVNKAKPLPSRLINELLPEVGTSLPRDLSVRRLPSELCNILNRDTRSPFYKLVKRVSEDSSTAVVTDSSIEQAIRRSLRPPLGALNQYKGIGNESSDIDAMYQSLVMFWNVVKNTFPDAWGLPPTQSRLMHSVGIRSMGALMDQIMLRADGCSDPLGEVKKAINRLKPYCRWTEGVWNSLGWQWNELQSTTVHINKLTDYLSRLDRELTRNSL